MLRSSAGADRAEEVTFMIDAMRQLALDYLRHELHASNSQDPEAWCSALREDDPGRLSPFLVERSDKVESYYTLAADPGRPDAAVVKKWDFKEGDNLRLPFNQPSGSQSAALGPVIKRTPKSRTKEAGPSAKIQQTTLLEFAKLAEAKAPWSEYFGEVVQCFRRPHVRLEGAEESLAAPQGAYGAAIDLIDEKKTVLLAYRDAKGRLPGEVPEYGAYLQAVLADTKYATQSVRPEPGRNCALCGAENVVVYPNALKGAGINLANMDREGAFPGVDAAQAWKGYATCGACADLLYVYKNHVAPDFYASVAGERALVIPSTQLDPKVRGSFVRRVRQFVTGIEAGEVRNRERRLLSFLADRAVTSLTFLWATFGQSIDDVRGIVTDVLPTRLNWLEQLNQQINELGHPAFPKVPLEDFHYDLTLFVLRPLLRRPGGQKAKSANASKRLFDLRRDLAAAIYHGRSLDLVRSREGRRFWDEILATAVYHLSDATERGDAWGLLYEGWSEKKHTGYLTPAGWVRQLARFLYYLRLTEVMPMPGEIHQPKSEALKPYFTEHTAIDSREKAFAFILGALYGKVMQVQAARGVNVGANALTWLKRLTLTGRDLPELYVKVREKLLAYDTEGSETVRQLVTELGELGAAVGHEIDLDQTQTCYYLLLGQSLATTIMPTKDKGGSPEEHASAEAADEDEKGADE
jgi:CRISPR-associated protein Csh1